MYIKVTNGNAVEYSLAKLRSDNPNVSFPSEMTDEVLSDFSVFKYTVNGATPSFDGTVSYLKSTFAQSDSGWVKNTVVENYDADVAAANVRDKRNQMLAETDWAFTSDYSGDTTALSQYRQALRDITSQAGFPYNVSWPVKP